MTCGTMSGARSNALIKSFAGRLPRTRENAAIVPITALVTVVINAIWSENKVASTQPGSEKKASYHRNENPLGGKRKNVVALNDIGTTSSDGRIRKARIAPAMP